MANKLKEMVCKGCRIYEVLDRCMYKKCIYPSKHVPKVLICPCSTCLIKMVCLEECEMAKQYFIISGFTKAVPDRKYGAMIRFVCEFADDGRYLPFNKKEAIAELENIRFTLSDDGTSFNIEKRR